MSTIIKRSWAEPYKIKMVEVLKMTSPQHRKKALQQAGFNTFLLRSEDVYIDLLTDSGTSAMSDRQWAGMMLGDEAYAGSRNFYHLEKVVQDVYGYKYLVPTHQGRGAENILSKILIKPGDIIPGNMYFTTTRLHQELAGGKFEDIIIDEAHDPENEHPFKGNVDLTKLEKLIKKYGAKRIPYISIATSVNMAGGQPISIKNLKELRALTKKHGIRVIHDMTRVAENAHFIQQREKGYAKKSIRQIVKEICNLTDGATMSAKKDALVNMGGFLSLKDKELSDACKNLLIITEGFATYGGLSGRDMEAIAIGLEEVFEPDYLHYRIRSTAFLGDKLRAMGVPLMWPVGGHAVYIDAKKLYPNIPVNQYPGQALVCELYLEGGIRTVEIGSVMFGKYNEQHELIPAAMELVRLAIPRRVYTQSHIEYVIEVFEKIMAKREHVKGLKIVEEPEFLRHFTCKCERL